jgi:hypothetical protein
MSRSLFMAVFRYLLLIDELHDVLSRVPVGKQEIALWLAQDSSLARESNRALDEQQ